MSERLGVAVLVLGIAARRGAGLTAYGLVLVVVLVAMFYGAALLGRSEPASPCWQEQSALAVQACFARVTRP